MEKDMLKQFKLYDEAGTTYLYMEPIDQEVKKVKKMSEKENINEEKRYEFIMKSLYEIDYIINENEQAELRKKVIKMNKKEKFSEEKRYEYIMKSLYEIDDMINENEQTELREKIIKLQEMICENIHE